MAMAVKLFDTGRLTSGQAAELAGMARVHFLYELGRWGVTGLQASEAELEKDLAVAARLCMTGMWIAPALVAKAISLAGEDLRLP